MNDNVVDNDDDDDKEDDEDREEGCCQLQNGLVDKTFIGGRVEWGRKEGTRPTDEICYDRSQISSLKLLRLTTTN
jgi:hypothetical protein